VLDLIRDQSINDLTPSEKTWEQGDQNGRIFTNWSVVFFGQFIENYRSSSNSKATFFPQYHLCINFYKNGFGYVLGDFFTNSSSHPAWEGCHSSGKKITFLNA
jgi:hypothetical protein